MKVIQGRFDTLLGKVNHTKPVPRDSIKATGKRATKTSKLPSNS
jgi:hypothetical protein